MQNQHNKNVTTQIQNLTKLLSKDTVHPKMKILSSITYLHVVSNLYDFVSSVEYKIRYFEESSLTNIIHSIFLCVLQKNECIQV